jgi:hypothetical protein
MTIPFRPAPRAAFGSTSGEKAEMARRTRRGRGGGVVLRGKIRTNDRYHACGPDAETDQDIEPYYTCISARR